MCFFYTQFNLIFFNLNKTKLIWIYDREKRPYKSKSTCNHKKDIQYRQYHKRPYETTIVRSGPCYVLQSHRWPWKHKAMILSFWTRDFRFNMNQFSLRTFYVRSTNFLLMIPRFQQEQEQQHQQQQQGFFKDLWAMLAVKKNMLSCITDSIQEKNTFTSPLGSIGIQRKPFKILINIFKNLNIWVEPLFIFISIPKRQMKTINPRSVSDAKIFKTSLWLKDSWVFFPYNIFVLEDFTENPGLKTDTLSSLWVNR